MSLDKATVRNIAFLARIEVPDEDLEGLANSLSGILEWIEQLQEVNTEDVDPMTGGTDMKLRWRSDRVSDGDNADEVLNNSPEKNAAFFVVPKVVE